MKQTTTNKSVRGKYIYIEREGIFMDIENRKNIM